MLKLRQQEPEPLGPDWFVCADKGQESRAFLLAVRLRRQQAGSTAWVVDHAIGAGSLKRQMKLADRARAFSAVIVFPEKIVEKVLRFKNIPQEEFTTDEKFLEHAMKTLTECCVEK